MYISYIYIYIVYALACTIFSFTLIWRIQFSTPKCPVSASAFTILGSTQHFHMHCIPTGAKHCTLCAVCMFVYAQHEFMLRSGVAVYIFVSLVLLLLLPLHLLYGITGFLRLFSLRIINLNWQLCVLV